MGGTVFKITIGILLGAAAAAAAHDGTIKIPEKPPALMAGANADFNAAVIRVDEKGRVYCSPEQLP